VNFRKIQFNRKPDIFYNYFFIFELLTKNRKAGRMENLENQEETKNPAPYTKREIFSKAVRAGKRTYFFDVKTTRNNEYYLTITESKRKFSDNGNFRYEKHKLFLYPEDFEKFSRSLEAIIQYIREEQPESKEEVSELADEKNAEEVTVDVASELPGKGFSDIDFEDI
jgi:hypothetical protein